MKNNEFNGLFEDLNFDIEEPHTGHEKRFFKKLSKRSRVSEKKGKVRSLWAPIIGIAASFLLAFFLLGEFITPAASAKNSDLASISSEMKQTQEFYTGVIKKELTALNEEKSPETEVIINDALIQMEKLDRNYENLKKDLIKSGKDNRVIHAMIQNFQQRIDLLNNVLTQIENIKTLKKDSYENNII
ncbi:hypothetical protein [Christiangramia forsetii]|uniref:Uncharacterized protein n=2 Tax=Christiangramia forsetii TaxID=411153 RepID=A0M2I1_CHRFK|nr:hypothetical protein [Christiangramia forsetii]GGG39040.1 hypothetical protein GCM10011532_23540 [Christiangramia forsetii]CAL66826.1 hypothetical protein GFO_1856 [Christiangramia forsetii KT0803]